MYYHPFMFKDARANSLSQSGGAMVEALLHSIESQQRVQMGALEIVARMAELTSNTQRHLVDLLRGPEVRAGSAHYDAETSRAEAVALRPASGQRVNRKQMAG
jgi:hypothetical protein